jgi:uncharacterized membrane protein YfcA
LLIVLSQSRLVVEYQSHDGEIRNLAALGKPRLIKGPAVRWYDDLAMSTQIEDRRKPAVALAGGSAIGTLGGLIGLGGAEFRLPLLIGLFRFPPLEAIILNKAMSLIVVASALVFRTRVVSLAVVASHLDVVANLLAGSLIGDWLGAGWATRMRTTTLYKVIAMLLVAIAAVLAFGHQDVAVRREVIDGWALCFAGAFAGLAIGMVASLHTARLPVTTSDSTCSL